MMNCRPLQQFTALHFGKWSSCSACPPHPEILAYDGVPSTIAWVSWRVHPTIWRCQKKPYTCKYSLDCWKHEETTNISAVRKTTTNFCFHLMKSAVMSDDDWWTIWDNTTIGTLAQPFHSFPPRTCVRVKLPLITSNYGKVEVHHAVGYPLIAVWYAPT